MTLSNIFQTISSSKQFAVKDYDLFCFNYFENKNLKDFKNWSVLTLYYSTNLTTTTSQLNSYKNENNLDNQDTIYHLKVRLAKALTLTPDCGYMAFALVQKFEIISTDIPNYDNKFILLIQPCPEFLGKDFFKTNNLYNVEAAKTSGKKIGFTYTNNYDKEKLPIFWSRKIIKTN